MSNARFYYSHDGQNHGPVSSAQLKELARSGQLAAGDWICPEGSQQWVPAAKVRGLFGTATVPAAPPAPSGLRPGQRLGEYEVIEPIGSGGMGAVYRARHLRLERIVAVKVLPPERVSSPEAIARFRREMKAVGQLDHPGIVRATDAGEAAGVHYLVMELVEGSDLARRLDAGPLPAAEACEVCRQAALALQYVADRGLVHRDVKPSNMMVTADGRIKLLDLGLARLDDAGAGPMTAAGQLMGTLDYLAPEQAMDASKVDIRADVYSLGCTLYHLLTGSVPFPGANAVQKIAAHQYAQPEPLENLCPGLPKELYVLASRMMAKRPEDRPQTPAAVAAALAPFSQPGLSTVQSVAPRLPVARASHTDTRPAAEATIPADPLPIAAVLASPSDTVRLPPRSRSGLFVALGLLGLLLVGGVAFLIIKATGDEEPDDKKGNVAVNEKKPEDEKKPDDKQPAEKTADEKKTDDKKPPEKKDDRATDPIPGLWRPDWEPGFTRSVTGHKHAVFHAELSPDGRHAATWDYQHLRLWDLERQKQLTSFDRYAYTVDLVTVSSEPKMTVFLRAGTDKPLPDAQFGKLAKSPVREQGTAALNCAVFSPDEARVASADSKGRVRVWDAKTGQKLNEFEHSQPVYALAFSPDGKLLLTAGMEKTIRLWDLEKDAQKQTFVGHTDAVGRVAFSRDGATVYSVAHSQPAVHWWRNADATVRTWDVRTGTELSKFSVADKAHAVSAACFSADRRRLVVGYDRGAVHVWDLEAKQKVAGYERHTVRVNALALTASGDVALSCHNDGVMWLYRLP